MGLITLTAQEGPHGFAAGQLYGRLAGVGGQGGIGAVRQQQPHRLEVIIDHGVMDRPAKG